jgi:hypothetical protein
VGLVDWGRTYRPEVTLAVAGPVVRDAHLADDKAGFFIAAP